MNGSEGNTQTEHVAEQLSGYIDGELTQQQRQRVELHCADCEACRETLAELHALRQRVSNSGLSELGEDNWRETMDDQQVSTTRSLGWILFIGGLAAISLVVLVAFLTADGMPLGMKLILVAIYGGLAVLLYSVGRQRLIERKTDKYKDVEI